MSNNINCDNCGKFINFSDLDKGGGGSTLFVPETPFTFEEQIFRCKKCTSIIGSPISIKNVVGNLTSFIH
jgi:hypothetical protein